MKLNVSFKYLENTPLIEKVLEKNLQKVEKRLKKLFKDSDSHLSLHLEKNPHREYYTCRLCAYFPMHVLKNDTQDKDLIKAINNSFSIFLKQLEKLKIKVEKHLQRKRS